MAVLVVCGSAGAVVAGQRGAPPPPSPLPQAPASGTGAISGVVIDGSTGQPIAGAMVLIGSGGRGIPVDPSRLATDAQGRYVFTRLPAGTYSLSASRHGYVNARYGQADPSSPSALRPIQIADGQWFPDARVVMWRTAAISGTVTDETGEPLVGVLVRVLARITIAGRPQLAGGATARTDDLGRYRVAGLAAGPYVVFVPSVQAAVPATLTLEELSGLGADSVKAAESSGRTLTIPDPPAVIVDASTRLIVGNDVTPPPVSAAAWSYPPTYYPLARAIADAAIVDVGRAEQRTGVDIRLAPVRTVRVSGAVQGPPGSTPARMSVRLVTAGNEGLGFGSETATAFVSADGAFRLVNVPAGTYTVIVSRGSMEYLTGDGASLYSTAAPPGCIGGGGGFFTLSEVPGSPRASYRNCGGDTSFSARIPLTVGDRDLDGVVVPLQRAVSLMGRIVQGDAAPAPDSPAARIGTPIFAEPADGDALLGLPSGRSLPDDPTRFRIDGLLPGQYVLQASGIGGAIKSIEWQGRDYTQRPFDTTSGRDIEDVVITMTRETARIRGSVRDGKGGVATGGMAIAFPTDRTLWTNYGLRPARLRSGQVSTSGAYGLVVPAGEYFVIALDNGAVADWMDPRFLNAAAAVATRVTVAWAETKAVDLSIANVSVRK
jgi:hypothetical protein